MEFPLTSGYFYKAKVNKDGFFGKCKPCCKEYKRKYSEDNKEAIANRQKQYEKVNSIPIAERHKKYSIENKESIIANSRIWYQANRIEILERHREYCRVNAVSLSEKNKKRYKKNRDLVLAYRKKYVQENPEIARLNCHKYKARKRKLPNTLTLEQWENIKEHFNNSCAYCGEEKPLTQEHYVALSKGGEYSYDNIIPACKSCNSSKWNHEGKGWFRGQEFYTISREKKILNHLGYKRDRQQLSIF